MNTSDGPQLNESLERCDRIRKKRDSYIEALVDGPINCGSLASAIQFQEAYVQAQQQVLADLKELFQINCL